MFAVIGGITFFIFNQVDNMIEDLEQDETIATTLPDDIKNLFYQKNIDSYPYNPDGYSKLNEFVVLTYGTFSDADGKTYDFTFDNSINESLGIDNQVNNNSLDGIIYVNAGSKDLGYYHKKSSVDKDPVLSKRAFQQYYILNFLDLKTKTVTKRDTLFGPMPKEEISRAESTGSALPTETELLEKIKTY